MRSRTYEDQKKDVQEQYQAFLSFWENLPAEGKRNLDLESVKKRKEAIDQNKFTLMVAGESKSGKSTFINAYMKTDILPMSVEQCTSAIIELNYSEKACLKYHTAAGLIKTVEGEDNIRSFLLKNAALNDEFKKIPIATIDALIITNKGKVSKEKIESLMNGLLEDNIFDLPVDKFQKMIKDYVERQTKDDKWKDTIVRFEVMYPFDPELKDIRIIDSPGVNSLGYVGGVTEKAIKDADAVVFIKSLSGQALESKSFREFLKRNANRHKESLFLLLSHASDFGENDLRKLVSSAREMFGNISSEKIIPIDSRVQRYYNRLWGETGSTIGDILKAEFRGKISFDKVDSLWHNRDSYDDFFDSLKYLAGFDEINELFNRYARVAQRVILSELLSELEQTYSVIIGNLVNSIKINEDKITKSPEEYAAEIAAKMKALEKLENNLNNDIQAIQDRYFATDGPITEKKTKIINAIKQALDNSDIDFLEQQITSITDSLKHFKEDMALEVITECNKALAAQCDKTDFVWDKTGFKGTLTPGEIQRIKKEGEEDDSVYTTRTEGVTFRETYRDLDRSKYVPWVKNHVNKEVENNASKAETELKEFLVDIFLKYRTKLNKSIEDDKIYIKTTADSKKTTEQVLAVIHNFKTKKTEAASKRALLNPIKNEVNNGLRQS